MSTRPLETICRIRDAAAITPAGTPNLTNEQVCQYFAAVRSRTSSQ
ncbi:hypothetical protein [Yokenella regensburgei]|nr:hypothetical protein [Yokenella regensburgei]EHM50897.1 hypothetical protein HMPREF0880_00877 [Yokenella regensburgei ATCC 43003]